MIESKELKELDRAGGDGLAIAGSTKIADAVVAQLAGRAAREVAGVHDMTASGFAQAFGDIAGRVTGQDQVDRGVVVQVGEIECIVDLNIVIEERASIPNVARAVRQSVKQRIGAVTGLQIKEININVADIYVDAPAVTAGALR
jgi:uncharacterized alkaline shock family protein YloU